MRIFILKRKKGNADRVQLEADRLKEEDEKKDKQKKRELFEEFQSEAYELGAMKKKPRPLDLE